MVLKMKRLLILCIFYLMGGNFMHAQNMIRGIILDENNRPIENVNIKNIQTKEGMTTLSDGNFKIVVNKQDLLEITKVGFRTLRIRIVNDKNPSYYNLVMNREPIALKEVDIKGKSLDYFSDSIRYDKTYGHILRSESFNDLNAAAMPLAYLSKKNRERWAFQEMYKQWEEQKYIDFVFNTSLVKRITYLQGNDLDLFMKIYRPSYSFLKTASTYEFLDYIKKSYYEFKAR